LPIPTVQGEGEAALKLGSFREQNLMDKSQFNQNSLNKTIWSHFGAT